MMKELGMLLWKDFRLSQICLFGGAVFLCLPYLVCAFTQVFNMEPMYCFGSV